MTRTVKRVGIGLIGCGRVVDTRHLPALLAIEGAKVVALADVDQSRVEGLGARFNVARNFSDARSLAECEEVDVVAVCTPPQFHAEGAIAALDAGKHLFVEKPLALDLEECDGVIERARTSQNLLATVGFNLRWHRLVREARRRVGDGGLGKIRMARTVLASGARRWSDFPEWRLHAETGGGALFELGVHHLDVLRFLLGSEFVEISATAKAGESTATFAARMSDGAQVTAAFCEETGEHHEIEIYGERGWLRVSCHRFDGLEQFGANDYAGALGVRLRGAARAGRELPRMLRSARSGGDYLASYTEQWRNFIGAIRGETEHRGATLEDGRRAVESALACIRSAASARTVNLSEMNDVFDLV